MKIYETMTDEALGARLRATLESGISEINCADIMKEVKPKKVVPRVAMINTAGDVYLAEKEFNKYCHKRVCDKSCRFSDGGNCFVQYLAEEINVTNEDENKYEPVNKNSENCE